MADIAQLAIKVDSSGVLKATSDLHGMEAANTTATKATNNLTSAGKANSQTMRNTALQLSQVAQQGAATGNYMQALAIQLPDLMLGFGTMGIAIGALAGAFAGPLFNALFSTNKELEEFNGRLDDTISNLKSTRVEVLTSDIDMLKKRISETGDEIERLDNFDLMTIRSSAARQRKLIENNERIEELNKQQIKDRQALIVLEEKLVDTKGELSKSEEMAAKRSEEYANAQRQYQSLLQQDIAATLDAEGRLAQQLSIRVDQYKSLYDEDLITNEQYLAAKEEATAAYYARLKALREKDAEAQLGFNNDTLSAFGSMIGNLTEIAQMGGEEQFDTWKRLAQAQAGISAAMAILSVLGDPSVPAPLKPPLAASFGALAAFQIAQIEQQEYKAREYGGQVSAGSSYLVGERGPEMITLGNQGGVVTPNSKLSDGEGTTVVLNVSTGVQASVRAEMMSLMPTIVKTAQSVAAAQSRKSR